jgi:hypothetical protein
MYDESLTLRKRAKVSRPRKMSGARADSLQISLKSTFFNKTILFFARQVRLAALNMHLHDGASTLWASDEQYS